MTPTSTSFFTLKYFFTDFIGMIYPASTVVLEHYANGYDKQFFLYNSPDSSKGGLE